MASVNARYVSKLHESERTVLQCKYFLCFAKAAEYVSRAFFSTFATLPNYVFQYGSCVFYRNLKMSVRDGTLSRREYVGYVWVSVCLGAGGLGVAVIMCSHGGFFRVLCVVGVIYLW